LWFSRVLNRGRFACLLCADFLASLHPVCGSDERASHERTAPIDVGCIYFLNGVVRSWRTPLLTIQQPFIEQHGFPVLAHLLAAVVFDPEADQ
jgi:hypothetical protein